jgi:hypothetical protein
LDNGNWRSGIRCAAGFNAVIAAIDVLVILIARDEQICMLVTIRQCPLRNDFPTFIEADSGIELDVPIKRYDQRVQICHRTALPQERVHIVEIIVLRGANDLSPRIDDKGFTVWVPIHGAKINQSALSPEERV